MALAFPPPNRTGAAAHPAGSYLGDHGLELSVVLPAYNEEDLLESAVQTVVEGLRKRHMRFEVLVVENGSTDRTLEIGRTLSRTVPEVRLLSLADADYGRALRAGLLNAGGSIVANFDVDFCDLDFLDRALVRLVDADAPAVVVGTKRGQGSVDTRAWPRRMVTSTFSLVLRAGFGLRVSDTHGIKAMNRSKVVGAAEECVLGTDLFDTELILRTERAGLLAAEIPVTVQELRPARSSMLRRIPRTLRNLARLRVLFWREATQARRRSSRL